MWIRGFTVKSGAFLYFREHRIYVISSDRNENDNEKNEEKRMQVTVKSLLVTARSASLEILDGGRYETQQEYDVYLNGVRKTETDRVITNIYGLKPDTDYFVELRTADGKTAAELQLTTQHEFVTLDVRAFGAKGDGRQDDTGFIQAAIMACPPQGRVWIPAGTYLIRTLFLKSDLTIELDEHAELSAIPDRELIPILPGLVQSYDEKQEYNMGSWEGNPLTSFASIITGIHVRNVLIYGNGCINGNASHENWWKTGELDKTAFRPRTIFLNHCSNVTVQGLLICNSPAWTIHPYFSEHLRFIGTEVQNPAVSPNTDGLDPESCRDMEIAGMHFSLGDDCIAVKSGKIYMGKTYHTPSEDIHIRQCMMENGHGAVTVGSEMAGGVKNLVVEDCIFRNTDRGLRIKTRRGRGKDAILDQIVFRNISMDQVMTPLVINSFYFCDSDGHTEYVQSRKCQPVDERTPDLRRMVFEHLNCTNCHVAAVFFEGLPEKKMEEIRMEDVHISFARDAKSGVPAMSEGVEECSRKGIFASNIKRLIMKDVTVEGQDGESCQITNVDHCE